MKSISRMFNQTIIEITCLIVLCVISFVVFNTHKVKGVIENVTYTDIDVIKNQKYIGVNNFTNDSQVKLIVSNNSNTFEDYKLLLTSNYDLTSVEDYLKIKIDNEEHLLKDLKIEDNYFLIDEGGMKANSKEIELYFAVDKENERIIDNSMLFYFVNDLTI